MDYYKKPYEKSAFEAKADAQRIAFAPVVFQVVKTMRDTGILDYLRKQKQDGATVAKISDATGISQYGVKVLLDAGLSADIVWLQEAHYSLTMLGHCMLSDKMTRVNMDFVHDVCYEAMFHLEEAIREEKPAGLKVFGDWKTVYEGLSSLPKQAQESWFAFDHFYSDRAFPKALPIVFKNAPKSLFDVGGNTGRWTKQCLNYNEDVHVTILDLPGQLAMAREQLEEAGLGDRASYHPIYLLDPSQTFPSNPDAIWMSQFLDSCGENEIISILKQAALVMTSDTDLFIMETFWDRQPQEAGAFSLNQISLYFTCVANGNSRMYHSGDMIRLVHRAGLVVEEEFDKLGIGHTILRCRKR